MSGVPAAVILQHIAAAQDHVLASVDGLGAEALMAPAAPSGWSMASMVNHLIEDDELFWVNAVLAGQPDAISDLRDGWSVPISDPHEVIARYARTIEDTRHVLATRELDRPPAWWPPAEYFPHPPYETGWHVCFHLLTEILTHAGHLDMARERIDGRQHLTLD